RPKLGAELPAPSAPPRAPLEAGGGGAGAGRPVDPAAGPRAEASVAPTATSPTREVAAGTSEFQAAPRRVARAGAKDFCAMTPSTLPTCRVAGLATLELDRTSTLGGA